MQSLSREIMNDYSMGALEALTWVRSLLDQHDKRRIKREILDALDKLHSGVALNFRQKIELMP